MPNKKQQHDIEAEEDVVFDDSEGAPDQIKKLKKELSETKEKCAEYLEGWQRARADLVNARKRDDEARKSFTEFAKEGIISDLLPVLDSFESAMGNKEAWEKVDPNWRTGVEYIFTQLERALETHKLVALDPIGKPFNPLEHDSVGHEEVDKKNDGKVVGVKQKGYKIGEKIIRPARVIVGEAK